MGVGASDSGGGGTGGRGSAAGGAGSMSASVPYAQTRLPRLSHRQYDNSVRDLLGLPQTSAPARDFIPDLAVSGYDNNGDALQVTDTLVRDYQRSAELLAESAVKDSLDRLLPCQPQGDGLSCAAQFIDKWGRRAFRRPLSADEQASYLRLFAGAATGKYPNGEPFTNGVRLVLEAILQSPHFLYRVELSHSNAAGPIQLSDHETAARLAFTLWNSLPDPTLDAEADAGRLHAGDQLRQQAERMLGDDKSRAMLVDFHQQWLQTNRYTANSLAKSTALYPEFTADLVPTLQEEAARFFAAVLYDEQANWSALLTAPTTFVDAKLARLYGLTASFGPGLTRVDLNPLQRAGFLTQVGFLAAHAHADQSSPIHRGVFVQRQLLCAALPNPPPGVTAGAAPTPPEAKSNRAKVTARTASPTCVGCHGLINPPGFGFEQYDAVGAFRQSDSGEPIDASGQLTAGDEVLTFSDGVSLARALAGSKTVRECYVRNWLRYGYGRVEQSSDMSDIQNLGLQIATPEFSVLNLLVAMTQTNAFRSRPEELQP